MKKISIIICLLAAMGTSAAAASIDAEVSLRRVTVSVTDTEKAEKPTVQVLDKNKTRVLYTAEGELSGDKYLFEDFSMGADEESDTYIIRIGENGKITEKEFYYASYSELEDMLGAAAEPTVTSASLVEAYSDILGVDKAVFSGFSDGWKNRITAEVKALTIDTSTDESFEASVGALKSVFSKWVHYANLAQSSNAELIDAAVKANTGFDTTYYTKLSDKTHISSAISACEFNPETVTETELSELFDGAVLTGTVIQNDWATGKAAVKYYNEKETISVETKYLNADAAVYKALKNKKVLNYKKLPDALKVCYDDGNSGSGGGGGGSSSGGTTINKTVSVNVSASAALNPVSSEETKPQFTDIDSVAWANDAINAFARSGVLSGRGSGIFAPNDIMTRAEFVKVMVLALGLSDESASADFKDVQPGDWHYSYIASAKKSGIIEGISETEFGADSSITREDMAVIAARAAESIGIRLSGTPLEFNDGYLISDYAKDAVASLSGAGIINGMGDGVFSPKTFVTRAQGAKVIYDLMNKK